MQRRRICKVGLFLFVGIPLLPLVLWVLVVLIAPTRWAHDYVVRALERSSGRSVQLDDLDVCLAGGIELTGLRIGAPGSTGDPWLVADRIQIDISLLQLLGGGLRPTYLEMDGGSLRVLRRKDGSLELADLVRPPSDGAAGGGDDDSHHRLLAKVHNVKVTIIDEPSQTSLTFEGVEGEASREPDRSVEATLGGLVNQGPFQFTAHLDRSLAIPSFEGEFRASDVVLEQGMNILKYAVPVLAGASGNLEGRLALDVYLRGHGGTCELLKKSLTGHGKVALDPIRLEGSPLLDEFRKIAALSTTDPIGSVRSDFQIRDRRIITERMALSAGRVPVVATGWTDLDGRLDYQVKVDGLAERVPDRARKLLGELSLDLDDFTTVRLSGTVDRVSVDVKRRGREARSSLEQLLSPSDRDRLRVLGRQLRDKVLR
jgi:AsmA protein